MTETSILDMAIPTETNTVRSDKFDRSTFETIEGKTTGLTDVKQEGRKELETFDPLVQDMFNSLYKFQPKVQDAEKIKSSHRFNKDLVERAMGTEQYQQLRQHTKLDAINSALATVTIANNLTDQIKGELKEQAEQANQLANAENQFQQYQQKAKSLQDIANQAQGQKQQQQYQKQAQQMQQQAQQAQQQMQQMQQQMQQGLQGAHNQMRKAVRAAQKEASDEMEEMNGLVSAWGTGSGSMQQMSPDERLQLAKEISSNKKLRKLAKMVGKFRRMAVHKQKTKIVHGTDEVYDTEMGNDISRVIPAEMALLKNPKTKKIWQRKFAEGELIQYKLRGKEKVGKGPIICCIDSSGSMQGDNEMWSKAVALGLLEVAKMQKREMAIIQFSSDPDDMDVVGFDKNDSNILKKIVHVATTFIGGGTDFEHPLSKAMEIMEASKFQKADVVFITDGMCGVSDSWLEQFLQVKKEKEAQVFSVLIGYHGDPDTATTGLFSDQSTTVSDMVLDDAEQIFGAV